MIPYGTKIQSCQRTLLPVPRNAHGINIGAHEIQNGAPILLCAYDCPCWPMSHGDISCTGGCGGGVNTSISGGPGYFLQENLRGNEQFKVWQRLILLRKLHE